MYHKTFIKPNSEDALYAQISDYLSLQYPSVIFHFDYGSGLKMTAGQAAKQKRLNRHRGFPDLFIAAPERRHHGLFLEIKRTGARLKKKNGEWASEHIAEQAEMLEGLRGKGYKAEFAVGFEQAKQIIDDYLLERGE